MTPETPIQQYGAPAPPQPTAALFVWPLRLIGVAVAGVVLVGGVSALITAFFHRESSQVAVVTQPVSAVVADTDAGHIHVRVGKAGSAVQVVTRREYSFHNPTAVQQVTSGVLTLTGRCAGGWGFGEQCNVHFELVVPPGTRLTMRSSAGSIEADGADAPVSASTSAGSITLHAARSADVSARTAAGSITLEFAAPPTTVHARTSAGSVTVVVPGDGNKYAIAATTSAGSRTVDPAIEDGSSRRTIEASTSAGSVTVRTG